MTVEFNSNPVMALAPDAELVVGVEDDPDGSARVYLGARYLNDYVTFPAGEGADMARLAWAQTHSSHLWVRFYEDAST